MLRYLFALLAALSSCAFAATPQPKPPYPTSLAVTQGTVTHSLSVPIAACMFYTDAVDVHGLQKIQLAQLDSATGRFKPCAANGSYLQFSQSAGPIFAQWLFPVPPPACVPPTAPAPVTQPGTCPAGTQGAWTQTATFAAASPQVPPDGCWVRGPWLPASAPTGACTAVTPPTWTPAVNVSADPMIAKPARGVTLTTRYGTKINRITDHAADTGTSMMRNDYSRRQPVNLDGTKLLTSFNDEYWYVYDISDPAHARFVERLNGPAGDAEIQWSATDADALLYLDRNGGTVLHQVKVSTNASSDVWDFGPIVRGFWPASSHCWTKSEGSPSADGRLWGLMCEDGNFNPLGFVVLDIVAKTATWHRDNSNRPDHVSIDPTGQYFVAGWNGSPGVISWNLATGAQTTLNSNAEHSDLGSCNGRGFYASMAYNTNAGDIFFTYLDDGVRHVVGYVYGHPNPWYGTNYGMHYSAKAFGVCGFLASNVGTPPANMAWYSLTAPNGPFGVGINYAVDSDYFDEVQGALARDGKSFFYNDNFGGPTQTGDVYRGTMPQ